MARHPAGAQPDVLAPDRDGRGNRGLHRRARRGGFLQGVRPVTPKHQHLGVRVRGGGLDALLPMDRRGAGFRHARGRHALGHRLHAHPPLGGVADGHASALESGRLPGRPQLLRDSAARNPMNQGTRMARRTVWPTLFLFVAFGMAGVPPAPAQAPAKRPVNVHDLFRLRTVRDVQLSPDGAWVAYVVGTLDSARDRSNSDLYMVSWDGSRTVQLTFTPDGENSPRWSPAGREGRRRSSPPSNRGCPGTSGLPTLSAS